MRASAGETAAALLLAVVAAVDPDPPTTMDSASLLPCRAIFHVSLALRASSCEVELERCGGRNF